MSLVLSKVLPPFIYPDGLACLALLVVILTMRKRRRIARTAAIIGFALLFAASTPLISHLLVSAIESQSVNEVPPTPADAIVVLSGGAMPAEPPEPFIQLGGPTANRLLYAAKLYRDGKAPLVIVSGGQLPWDKNLPPQSAQMAEAIEMMGVPASAIVEESESGNTYENAVRTKAILDRRSLHRIILVTSALHMPRALGLFRDQGVEAFSAPTDFISVATRSGSSFPELMLALVPSAQTLDQTTQALKELLGAAVYRIAGAR
jgi:uncharacterized SAM-binding protein YcdF (DUF218 family)